MEVNFYLDEMDSYNSNLDYLSFCVGNMQEGSLYSKLVQGDYITSLEEGIGDRHNNFFFYFIRLELTVKGLNQVYKVLKNLIDFIDILKENEANKLVYDEMIRVKNLRFAYMEVIGTPNNSLSLDSRKMFQIKNYSYFLSNNFSDYQTFNARKVNDYLKRIRIENCLVIIGAVALPKLIRQDIFEGQVVQTEEFSKTNFFINSIKGDFLEYLKSDHIAYFPSRKPDPYLSKLKGDILKDSAVIPLYRHLP